jgi:hypothetical protein
MRGEFVFFPGTAKERVIPNMICNEGEEAILKMAFQNDDTIVAGGGNFYIGLTDDTLLRDATLASLLGEPTSDGGYARQPVTRDTTGWPTIELVNGIYRVSSEIVTFAATGAAFSKSITKAFLCNAASGASGVLFAFSGAFEAPVLLADGQTLPTRYRLYLK